MKKCVCLLLCCALLFSCAGVLAEQAKVQTPGGKLNMRVKPDTRSNLVEQIPNHATVTYLGAADEDWSKVTYKGRTGYVQTIYLNLTRLAEGKEIYPDGRGPLYIRSKASESGAIQVTVAAGNAVRVLKVEDEWTKVSYTDPDGKTIEGYVLTDRISDQYTSPQLQHSSMNQLAVLQSNQTLYYQPGKTGEKGASLKKGQELTVVYVEGSWCYVVLDSITSGFLPVNAVELLGKEAEATESPLARYSATYYLCTVPSGQLPVYVEPTSKTDTELHRTLAVDPEQKLAVIKSAYQSHGQAWAQVVYEGNAYWTPARSIKVSKETKTAVYARPVSAFTGATVYAKKGAKLYADGSVFSKVLCTIAEGAELEGGLRENCISVTYQGKSGYVMWDDVVCGIAMYQDAENDWQAWAHLDDPAPAPTITPKPIPDTSRDLSAKDAREKADAALKAAYGVSSFSGMDVKWDKRISKQDETAFMYHFSYFKNGKYLYDVTLHAVTGKTLSTADYSDFAQTISHATAKPAGKPTAKPGELSYAQARNKADAFLGSTYGGFTTMKFSNVEVERFNKMPSYDFPVFRLNYWTADGFGFTCILKAADGSILYHTDVENAENTEISHVEITPIPAYNADRDMGRSAAQKLAENHLRGKYPQFSSVTISRVDVNFNSDKPDGYWELPYYSFTFFGSDISEFFSCVVHAYTGTILYSDYSDMPGSGNG